MYQQTPSRQMNGIGSISTDLYQRITTFSPLDGTINSSAFGALDKLNSTIISLYTDPNLHFADWEQANRYLSSKFTEKAIRVPVKKPVKSEVVENEDEIIND